MGEKNESQVQKEYTKPIPEKEISGEQEVDIIQKIPIPRPGIVVHPKAPQRLNVDGEPIIANCCG